MFDQIVNFLDAHQSLAGWASALGSSLGLLAAYWFGRGDKINRQKAQAMYACVLMNDLRNAAVDVVVPVLEDQHLDEKTFEFLASDFSEYQRQLRELNRFPAYEIPLREIKNFHLYRVLATNLRIELEIALKSGQSINDTQRALVEEYFDEMDKLNDNFMARYGLSAVETTKRQKERQERLQKRYDAYLSQRESQKQASNRKRSWW